MSETQQKTGVLNASVSGAPPEDETTRRYRELMAQALMRGGPQQSAMPAPVAATGNGAWMSGLASVLGGTAQGLRQRDGGMGAFSGGGAGSGNGQFSLGKAFSNWFGGGGDGGMKGPV